MAEVFGLSDKGFKRKDFSTIKGELEKAMLAEVDSTLRFEADTVAGVVTAIVANQAGQVWEALNGLYHSLQPNSATGRALDALCSLTGTYRKKASCSKAIAIVTLDAKAKVPESSRVQSIGGHFFKFTKEVNNAANIRMDLEAELIAEAAGPTLAHVNTEAKIMTPTAGFRKVVFKQTQEVGRLDETDYELRLRRIAELKAIGTSTADALRSRLKQLDQVEAVYIKESSSSFEVIIQGGKEQEIADTIWQCKPLGIETSGAIQCTITDSINIPRAVCFSRPTEIPLTLKAKLKVKRLLDDNELNVLKNSLVDCSKKHFSLGSEVYASRFYASLLNDPLILDVMSLQMRDRALGTIPVEIKPEQIASLNFSDIDIKQQVEAAQ